MQRLCGNCRSSFEVTPEDLAFYDRVSPVFAGNTYQIPPPTFCPDCRFQRRLTFRNERNLYHRTCDLTGEKILAAYAPEYPYTVYENEVWWSDRWDPFEYGRDYDFSRTFFDQFKDLLYGTPFINILNTNNQNSSYTMYAGHNKDCYLLFCSSYNEECMYCYNTRRCFRCVDCIFSSRNQLCYECINCFECHSLLHSYNCRNCSSSWYLEDCLSCQDCLCSIGLRNASHRILNQECSKEDFEKRLEEFRSNPAKHKDILEAFENLRKDFPRPWSHQVMTENCTGDDFFESKNCRHCFEMENAEDCAYCMVGIDMKDCQDVTMFGVPGELLYECNNIGLDSYHCCFNNFGYGINNVFYSYNVYYSSHCFGCANMHHRKYCVFNKQYAKEEYEELVGRIAAHMQSTGKWGQFSPTTLSPFAYNETSANEHFPLTQKEVEERGWRWRRPDPPEPSATHDAMICSICQKPFKVIPQEHAFYEEMRLPMPKNCPNCRHYKRLARRNPHKLWKRLCMKCGEDIQTSYAPEKPETVYCERCYLETVY